PWRIGRRYPGKKLEIRNWKMEVRRTIVWLAKRFRRIVPRGIKEKTMRLARVGWAAAAALMASMCVNAQARAKHPITFDDLMQLHRVSAPQVSPDGKWVAFAVSTPDMDANRNASNIWVTSTAGDAARQLTQSGRDSAPAWSADGKTLAFLSSRDGS